MKMNSSFLHRTDEKKKVYYKTAENEAHTVGRYTYINIMHDPRKVSYLFHKDCFYLIRLYDVE